MNRRLLMACVWTLVGCSGPTTSGPGDSSASGSVSGTVDGHPFAAISAIAYERALGSSSTNDGPVTTTYGVELLLSDKPLDCTTIPLANSTMLDIDVVGQPVAAAPFNLVDAMTHSAGPGEASSDFNVVDKTCNTLLSQTAKSGKGELTKVGATVEGWVDVAVAGGRIQGAFKAVKCGSQPSLRDSKGALICK